jgi:hypothetical protein
MLPSDHWLRLNEHLQDAKTRINAHLARLQHLRSRGHDIRAGTALLKLLLEAYDAMEECAEIFWPEHVLHQASVCADSDQSGLPPPRVSESAGPTRLKAYG